MNNEDIVIVAAARTPQGFGETAMYAGRRPIALRRGEQQRGSTHHQHDCDPEPGIHTLFNILHSTTTPATWKPRAVNSSVSPEGLCSMSFR